MRPLWRHGFLSAAVVVLHPSADLAFKVGGSGDEGKWEKSKRIMGDSRDDGFVLNATLPHATEAGLWGDEDFHDGGWSFRSGGEANPPASAPLSSKLRIPQPPPPTKARPYHSVLPRLLYAASSPRSRRHMGLNRSQ